MPAAAITHDEQVARLLRILDDIRFPEYTFCGSLSHSEIFIWATYMEADTLTGKTEVQETRHWFIPSGASDAEIVATCFKCIITSYEHRVREWFTYQNKAIYQPHHDLNRLLSICEDRPHA